MEEKRPADDASPEPTEVSGLERTVFNTRQVEASQLGSVAAPVDLVLEPGSLRGQFRLIENVGRGAQGVVWKAHDEALEQLVALKFLPAELAASSEAMTQMREEAKVLLDLSHENIVRLRTLEATPTGAYLVMEFLAGPTLSGVLKRRHAEGERGLSVDEALWLLDQIAPALDYANQKGVTHRDIKPANLMLTAPIDGRLGEGDEQAKLCDFGVAFLASTAMNKLTGFFPAGTMAYIAPEVLLHEKPTLAADLYSLGATLYCLVSGQPIFRTGEPVETITTDIPAPLESGDAQFDAALAKALVKRPEDRFKTADEFLFAASGGRLGGKGRGLRGWSPRRSIAVTVAAVALTFGGRQLYQRAVLGGELVGSELPTNAESLAVSGTLNSKDISDLELRFDCHEGEHPDLLQEPVVDEEGTFQCAKTLPSVAGVHDLSLLARGKLLDTLAITVDRSAPVWRELKVLPEGRPLDVSSAHKVRVVFEEEDVVDFRLVGYANLLSGSSAVRAATVSLDIPSEGVSSEPREALLLFQARDGTGNVSDHPVQRELYNRELLIAELEKKRPQYVPSGRWALQGTHELAEPWRKEVAESAALLGDARDPLERPLEQLGGDFADLPTVQLALAARHQLSTTTEGNPPVEVHRLFTQDQQFELDLEIENSRTDHVDLQADDARAVPEGPLEDEQDEGLTCTIWLRLNETHSVSIEAEGAEALVFDIVHDDREPRILAEAALQTNTREPTISVSIEESSPLRSVFLEGVDKRPLERTVGQQTWTAEGVSVPEGESTLSVTAIDEAGNEATHEFAVSCDSLPPVFQGATPSTDVPILPRGTEPLVLVLEFNELLAGDSGVELQWKPLSGPVLELDPQAADVENTRLTASVVIPSEEAGSILARHTSTDFSGNQSSQTLEWRVLDHWGDLGDVFRSAGRDPAGLILEADHYYPERFHHGPSGLDFVLVRGGEFEMGTADRTVPEGEPIGLAPCKARMSPFYIGRTEVSWRTFERGGGQARDDLTAGDSDRNAAKWNEPAEVLWEDAKQWCAKNGFELPTEARWEFAASGSRDLDYPWSNLWIDANANGGSGTLGLIGEGGAQMAAVDSLPAGASSWCQALHMAGNAWEWCLDIWPEDVAADDLVDPLFSWEGQGPKDRIVRGGSYYSRDRALLHTANRLRVDITVQKGNKHHGFRPVWALDL